MIGASMALLAAVLVEPGLAGLETPLAGVWFDDFQVRLLGPAPP